MRVPVYEGFISEGPDPFLGVTDLTVFFLQVSLDVSGTFCLDMYSARTVADLTAGIFHRRRFFDADKPAGFAISCRMAKIAAFDLFFREAILHPFNGFERL